VASFNEITPQSQEILHHVKQTCLLTDGQTTAIWITWEHILLPTVDTGIIKYTNWWIRIVYAITMISTGCNLITDSKYQECEMVCKWRLICITLPHALHCQHYMLMHKLIYRQHNFYVQHQTLRPEGLSDCGAIRDLWGQKLTWLPVSINDVEDVLTDGLKWPNAITVDDDT